MLSTVERTNIVNALRAWAQSAENQPMLGFIGSGQPLTPRQIVSAIQNETDDGKAILEILEHGVRREGMSRVVDRLTRSLKTA